MKKRNKKILVKHVNLNHSLVLETTTQHQQSSLSQTGDCAIDMRELPVEVLNVKLMAPFMNKQALIIHLTVVTEHNQTAVIARVTAPI